MRCSVDYYGDDHRNWAIRAQISLYVLFAEEVFYKFGISQEQGTK
jgi:hypothetical protein